MRLAFSDTRATIEVPDDEEFLAALKAAAPGWRYRKVAASGPPLTRVAKRGASYRITSPEHDPVEASAVSAACAVVADLAGAFADDHPGRLCLHGAAVRFGDQLVILPSRSHAGKSTLVARLAAAGHTVFGDDMVPVSGDDRCGIAMGVAPRLRLPLPERSSPVFRAFVSGHASAADGRYLYLALPQGRLAPRGAEAPIGAVLLLDRRADGPAELSLAPRNAVMQALIRQNVARGAAAAPMLARVQSLVERVPRLMLAYSDLEEATSLIERTFAVWPPRTEGLRPAAPVTLTAEAARALEEEEGAGMPAPRRFSPVQRLSRAEGVALTNVDGELFLAGGQQDGIFQLNAMAEGLWNLLAEPVSEEEAAAVVAGAFPDADRRTIDADVAAVFAGLAEAGLVRPA